MATTAKIAKEAETPKFKVRLRNRCKRCGRPRAYLRKFALCRLCFRQLALEGDIAGVTKRAGRRAKAKSTNEHDRPDRRHAHPDPERDHGAASARRHAALAPEGRDRQDPRDEGYIQSFKVVEPKDGEPQGTLRVLLKYGPRGERVITGIQRVSRPGRRVYFGRDRRPRRPRAASAAAS